METTMKKAIMVFAVAALAGSLVASAQEVLSQNAVGFVKRDVPAGKLQIVSIPFVNMDNAEGTYKFGDTDMALSELQQNDSVMFWDADAQVWIGGVKGKKGWAAAQSNHVVKVGEAFFVRSKQADDISVTAQGEVPDDESLATSYAGGKALSIMAYPFPVEQKFGTTTLAEQLPQNASVMFWDDSAQVWIGGVKGKKGWAAAQSNHVIQVGEGFFVRTPEDGATWEAVRPYTWPHP